MVAEYNPPGGGLPEWWTVDTEAKTVTVEFPDDPDGDYIGLIIEAPADFDGFAALQVLDQESEEFIRLDLAGIRVGLSVDFHTVIASGSVAIDDRDHDDIILIATHSNDDDRTQDIAQFYKNTGAAMLWGVNKSGLEYKQNNDFTEPDDGDVAANQILEWYDSTENAIAARFKAQDSAGNAFAGKVATMLPDGSAFMGVDLPLLAASPTVAQISTVLAGLGLTRQT